MPDSKQEVSIFKKYYQQQEKLEYDALQNEQSKNAYDRFLIALRGKVVQEPQLNIDEYKDFCIEAYTCGVPGCKVKYSAGDIVMVGFVDNQMHQPIILGMNMYKSRNSITTPNISALTLNVEQTSQLSSSTTISTVDERWNTIQVQDIVNALCYIKQLQDAGIDAASLTSMFSVLGGLSTNNGNMQSIFGDISNAKSEEDQKQGS